MSKPTRFIVVLLRLAVGWSFVYAGITKVLDPEWTAEGYLTGASTLPHFYSWLASGEILPWVDLLNQWGLLLIGASLILGLFVRISSFFGVLLMILYYIPELTFPYVGDNALIINEHIIFALTFLFFMSVGAGKYAGFDKLLTKKQH